MSGLNDGDYRVQFVGMDEEGYVGDGESILRVQDAPESPAFYYPTEAITRTAAELVLSGWAPAFSVVRLYDDGELATSPPQLGAGNGWDASLTLSDGTHVITATATDYLGQVSPPGRAGQVTVDTQPPSAQMTALASYQSQAAITLGWSGSDPAPGTGVRDYDVQQWLRVP